MSFSESKEINFCSHEADMRVNGKRVIDYFELEISDHVPSGRVDARTDWFRGRSFRITYEQAVALRDEIMRAIEIMDALGDGVVVLKGGPATNAAKASNHHEGEEQ